MLKGINCLGEGSKDYDAGHILYSCFILYDRNWDVQIRKLDPGQTAQILNCESET